MKRGRSLPGVYSPSLVRRKAQQVAEAIKNYETVNNGSVGVSNSGSAVFNGPVNNTTNNAAAQAEDEAEDEPLPPKNGIPQSRYPGVFWNRRKGKWVGAVTDITQRYKNKKGVSLSTSYYSSESECYAAVKKLKEDVHQRKEARLLENVANDPICRDLPRGPYDPEEAEAKTAYWRPCHKRCGDPLKPFKAVAVGRKKKNWKLACKEEKCLNQSAERGLCFGCGGHCPHGRPTDLCAECSGTKVLRYQRICSSCPNMISYRRKESNGGPGICAGCELRVKEEHERLGLPFHGTVKGMRVERWLIDVHIRPRIVDRDGVVISPELRDQALGRGCKDTDHVRRPDVAWVKHSATGRPVAVICFEVDENSHTSEKRECEVAKVCGTFASIVKIANDAAEKRGKNLSMPYFLTIKFNPDACPGAPPIEDRISWAVRQINDFMAKPAEFYRQMPRKQRMLPNVQFAFYNSKKHLDYFQEVAPNAMHILGNYIGNGAGPSSG